jgi:hypothetical protein
MKKLTAVLIAVMFVFTPLAYAGSGSGSVYSGDCVPDATGFCADDFDSTVQGPAPNSGDGVPDGSGFDPRPSGSGMGPAPNSGDGIPDGSGF